MQFSMMDESLRCIARANAFVYATGAPWGRPPSGQGQGPGHDPFDPSTPPPAILVPASSSTSARTALLSNSMDCGELMSSKYTRVGIGYTSGVWVVILASE
jgi:hypothetical protein